MQGKIWYKSTTLWGLVVTLVGLVVSKLGAGGSWEDLFNDDTIQGTVIAILGAIGIVFGRVTAKGPLTTTKAIPPQPAEPVEVCSACGRPMDGT